MFGGEEKGWTGLVGSRAVVLAALVLLLALACPARAHSGPPYPVVVDRTAGPYVVSVWADPDVGVGTFYVTLEGAGGGALPEDLSVEVAVRPVSGRLPEAVHQAARDRSQARVQFVAEVPFDAEERWTVRVSVRSSVGAGEVATEVEVTPPGLGRYDLLVYLLPFAAVGFLWVRAVLRRRGAPRRRGR